MSQRSVERQLASVGSQRSSLVAIGRSSAITNPESRSRSLTTCGESPFIKAFFATRASLETDSLQSLRFGRA